jgi:hypothetical protein
MQLEDLFGREPSREAEQLREIAELGARARVSRGMPTDVRIARSGTDEPAADLDQRGFPRSVRTQKSYELPLLDVEADALERSRPGIGLV